MEKKSLERGQKENKPLYLCRNNDKNASDFSETMQIRRKQINI